MSPALVESFPTIPPAFAPSAIIDLSKYMPIQNEEECTTEKARKGIPGFAAGMTFMLPIACP
jgi:hypothetical protein